jgi:hypothetical protein
MTEMAGMILRSSATGRGGSSSQVEVLEVPSLAQWEMCLQGRNISRDSRTKSGLPVRFFRTGISIPEYGSNVLLFLPDSYIIRLPEQQLQSAVSRPTFFFLLTGLQIQNRVGSCLALAILGGLNE